MADDLDDFFEEIEEAEAEAVKEEDHSADPAAAAAVTGGDTTTTDKEETNAEPAAKRAKTEASTPTPVPIRPRGVVVAAASSAVIRKPPPEGSSDAPNNAFTSTSSHNGFGASGSNHLPPASAAGAASPPPPPPPPLPPAGTAPPQSDHHQHTTKKNPIKRMAAGKVWVDPTLDEWPENDFRIFVGNLDKSVTDQQVFDHYKKYASLAKAKVVQDSSGTSKGYGFVSFLQPLDCAKAIRETDQTWLGSRPIRVKRSDWKDRNMNQVLKQNKKQSKQRKRMGL